MNLWIFEPELGMDSKEALGHKSRHMDLLMGLREVLWPSANKFSVGSFDSTELHDFASYSICQAALLHPAPPM